MHVAAVGLAVFAVALTTGCRSEAPAEDVRVEWDIRPDPPQVGSTAVVVTISDTAGHPIQDARVDVEATMTHPGMRPEMAAAEEIEPGRYEAALTFSMGGDWVLLLQAELPDGRVVQRERELPGVASR